MAYFIPLAVDEAREPLEAMVKDKLDGQTGEFYLKVGRITTGCLSVDHRA